MLTSIQRMIDHLDATMRGEGWTPFSLADGRIRYCLAKRRFGLWNVLALIDGDGLTADEASECVAVIAKTAESLHGRSRARMPAGLITLRATHATALFVADGVAPELKRKIARLSSHHSWESGMVTLESVDVRCGCVDLGHARAEIKGLWQPARTPSRRRLRRAMEPVWPRGERDQK